MLKATHIAVQFDGLTALDDAWVELDAAEIVGLIGPNGAGKTTMLNVISGFQQADAGTVTLNGRDITRLPPHRRARRGIRRTFQGGHFFGRLTVLENVEVGAVGVGRRRGDARRQARQFLNLLDLGWAADIPADALPFGAERRLEIARAAVSRPEFLLLDEPAAGLNEPETDLLLWAIREIATELRCGVLVVEHNMSLIMKLCARIQVLNYGRLLFTGSPEEVQANTDVVAAYLGSGAVV